VQSVIIPSDHNYNAFAVAGSTVKFTCKTNSTRLLRWTLCRPHSSAELHIYTGEKLNQNFTDRYEVSNISEDGFQITLTIKNIQPSDAGKHQCREIGAPKYNRTFEVIVLGKLVMFYNYVVLY
jgi:Immunoglobulin V-set domain